MFSYSTDGAAAAAKADQRVRDSVQRTGKVANRQSGRVERWMQANKEAIQGLGIAAGAAMGAVLASSGRMRAELSGVRSAFGLLADTIVSDVLPNTGSLSQSALNIAQAYRNLPGPVRTAMSIIGAFVGIVTALLPIAAALITSVSTIATAVGGSAGLASAFSTLVGYGLTVVSMLGSVVTGLLSLVSLPALVVGAILAIVAAFATDFMGIRTKAINAVQGVYNAVKDWLGKAKTWVVNKFVGVGQAIYGPFKGAYNTAKDWLGDLRDAVKTRLKGIKDWIGDKWSGLKSSISDPIINAYQTVKDELGDFKDWLKTTIIQGWNSTIGSASLEFPEITVGGGTIAGRDLPSATVGGQEYSFPKLNTGGLIEDEGLAMLHAGERVMPAAQVSERGEQPTSNGDVTIQEINISMRSSGNPSRDANRLVDEVSDEFDRKLGGRGV